MLAKLTTYSHRETQTLEEEWGEAEFFHGPHFQTTVMISRQWWLDYLSGISSGDSTQKTILTWTSFELTNILVPKLSLLKIIRSSCSMWKLPKAVDSTWNKQKATYILKRKLVKELPIGWQALEGSSILLGIWMTTCMPWAVGMLNNRK